MKELGNQWDYEVRNKDSTSGESRLYPKMRSRENHELGFIASTTVLRKNESEFNFI
jgi:hypothetical protein